MAVRDKGGRYPRDRDALGPTGRVRVPDTGPCPSETGRARRYAGPVPFVECFLEVA
jgi:hypothetical protein